MSSLSFPIAYYSCCHHVKWYLTSVLLLQDLNNFFLFHFGVSNSYNYDFSFSSLFLLSLINESSLDNFHAWVGYSLHSSHASIISFQDDILTMQSRNIELFLIKRIKPSIILIPPHISPNLLPLPPHLPSFTPRICWQRHAGAGIWTWPWWSWNPVHQKSRDWGHLQRTWRYSRITNSL